MIYVNILTTFSYDLFYHQLDRERYRESIYFVENSNEDIVWDYVVVYENILPNLANIKYKKGGLIFISGEPEDSNPYCHHFLNQFDHIISSHSHYKSPKNHLSQQALNWHFGFSHETKKVKYPYLSLRNLEVPQKVSDISMICSSKTMMPGHVVRYDFYKCLSERFAGKIDFFGAGIKFIDDKADAILPYRFHICIENSSVEHYWTEKIADAILGYSVPIYFGCPNISEYFPSEAVIVIDIHDKERTCSQIERILQNPQAVYIERFPYILTARNYILDRYNIFPMLENFFTSIERTSNEIRLLKLIPWNNMLSWRIRFFRLRIYRFVCRLFR
ncbi:MAG: glycosyltransferase family 10 [Bacteroidales bacterium]|nr:glycosyltransferase family 10 [Bacteroidales bacterium]